MNPTKGSHTETVWPFAKGPKRTDRFRAEQVRMLYRSGPVGVVGATLGAFGLASVVLYLGARSLRTIQIWLAIMVVTAAIHLLLARAYRRASTQVTEWRQWAGWFTAVCLVEGLNWGATAIYTASPQNLISRLLTMALICAITSGSLPAFGFYLPAFYVLFFPATVPFAVVNILQGGMVHYVLALLTLRSASPHRQDGATARSFLQMARRSPSYRIAVENGSFGYRTRMELRLVNRRTSGPRPSVVPGGRPTGSSSLSTLAPKDIQRFSSYRWMVKCCVI